MKFKNKEEAEASQKDAQESGKAAASSDNQSTEDVKSAASAKVVLLVRVCVYTCVCAQ
jgi:hypothetical protein